ncbi:MAG TPA: HAMP domain-containing sensor histidine kinase [Streptosporangiaceae bacterium]|nr:HAMP domain-containing sensor histidine kinase [Streptosporangiaceae bacterium]
MPGRWLTGLTLRARLIAGLLTLLALCCAIVGGATYFAANRFLLIQLDSQLQTSAAIYAQACQKHGGPPAAPPPGSQVSGGSPPCGSFPGQPPYTLDASVRNGAMNGNLSWGADCNLTKQEQTALTRLAANGQPQTLTLASLGGDYRLESGHGPGGSTLITGLPMGSMQGTLHDLEATELIVFAGVLLLAGVLGTGLVGTSLRPLRRVAATASRVTQLPLADGQATLSERVPDTNPGTEVGRVGIAFNRMLGHVESALSRRAASEARLRSFAADASHELRTPLAAIRGYAELARRHPGPVPDEVAHALGRVEAESARMSVLVDELLLLARLDAGRPLERAPVDLTRLAIDATSDARAAGQDHRWVLELPGEPVLVLGDEHSLHQVVANLLSNARVHTPAGTTVTVRLTAPGPGADGVRPAAPDPWAGGVRLSVTDDGPGIPAAVQPTLFGRFVRGSGSRSSASGGAGLGLAIVDAVVAAHRGTVTMASHPGSTQFTIALPASPPPPPA